MSHLTEVYILRRAGEAEAVYAEHAEAKCICDAENAEEDPEFGDHWSVCPGLVFIGKDYHQVYVCKGCGEYRTWCDGGTDSEFCDKCWAESQRPWWLKWLSIFIPTSGHGCGDCA